MTSRENLQRALHFLPAEKIPMDIGATAVSGLHVSCVAQLREYYGLPRGPVKVTDPCQMLGEVDEDLKAALGCDVEMLPGRGTVFGFPQEGWKEWRLDSGLEVLVPGGFNTTTDAAGNHYIHPMGDISAPPSGHMPKNGYYFDAVVRQPPFDDEDLNPEDNLEEFGPISPEDLETLREGARRCAASGRGVVANFSGTGLGDIALVPGLSLRHPKGIRDIEEWYISTVTRQDYLHQVFARQTDIAVENLKRAHAAVGEAIDVVFLCGTDFGTQNSTFCSADTFRELYMPYYQKMTGWIHENTGWKIFKHSCGAVEGFIPLFLEAGFDILQPVQCSATGMDPALLKEKYAGKMVFWGGGVDTQHTLPFGTPEEVRVQVLQRCEVLGQNSGYVFGAIHNIQAKTPVENIVAMVNALHEFNK